MGSIKVEIDSVIKDIVPKFMDARKSDIESMKKLLEKENLDAIKAIAHKIKGNAGSYGFHQLGDIAKQLEKACMDQQTATVKKILADMNRHLQSLKIVFVDRKI